MKKILVFISLLVSVCAFAQKDIKDVVPNKPNPPRLVNDFTNTLTPEQREALEAKLVKYDDSTSNQVVVVIIKTLDDFPIEDVSLRILRDWGVGNKDKNNGIVVLIAKEDHKIRIEVGYGLEGAVPDVTANHIIENDFAPNFREDNYYRGIDLGTDDIIKAAAGEYQAPEGYSGRGRKRGIPSGAIFVIVLIIWILIRSSSGGGRGGGMLSRRGYGGFFPFIWPGGGGGWSGGGGSGGGWSGGGGGFGGFGGGGGGGGGASGSW